MKLLATSLCQEELRGACKACARSAPAISTRPLRTLSATFESFEEMAEPVPGQSMTWRAFESVGRVCMQVHCRCACAFGYVLATDNRPLQIRGLAGHALRLLCLARGCCNACPLRNMTHLCAQSKGGVSYFDRLWSTGISRHSASTERYY